MRFVRNLVTMTVAVVATLAVLEIGLRLLSRHALLLLDVEMWSYARTVKAESHVPGMVEEHRPNASAKLMGVSIRTDANGFRRASPEQEALRGPNDRIVVALGDSFTLGWGAPEGGTYADVLEQKLNERAAAAGARRTTVLNAGIGNSNTSMEVARFERIVRPLEPEWLILGFLINDAEPDPQPSASFLIRHSALANLFASRVGVRVDDGYQTYDAFYRALYAEDAPGWIRTQEAFAELGASLREDGIPGTLLLIPELHEPKDFGPFADIYARVAALGRQHGFEVVDPSGRFPAGSGERFWVTPYDAHPNAEAHEILATALVEDSRHAARLLQP